MNKENKTTMKKGIIILLSISIPFFIIASSYIILFPEENNKALEREKTLEIMKRYPTPELLENAINTNEIDYEELTPELKRLMEFYMDKNKGGLVIAP